METVPNLWPRPCLHAGHCLHHGGNPALDPSLHKYQED